MKRKSIKSLVSLALIMTYALSGLPTLANTVGATWTGTDVNMADGEFHLRNELYDVWHEVNFRRLYISALTIPQKPSVGPLSMQ